MKMKRKKWRITIDLRAQEVLLLLLYWKNKSTNVCNVMEKEEEEEKR